MRSALNLSVLAIVIAAAASVAHAAEDAQAVFDSIYGPKLKLVQITPATADDIELAKSMLESARGATSTPDLLLLMCKNAYELGSKDPEGYDTAIEAKKLEAQTKPELKAAAFEAIVAVQQRRYNAAKTADKAAAGEALIDALLAQAFTRASDLEAAIAIARRAQGVASTIKSPRQAQIKAGIDAVQARHKLNARIDELKAKLKDNPADKAAGRELVMIYLVNLDSPAEAHKFTFLLDDAELKDRIGLADSDPATLDEKQAMDMGEWYRKLADGEISARLPLLTRAHTYYQRFLDLHTTEDLERTKATLVLKSVRQTLDAAKVEIKPATTPGRPSASPTKPQIASVTWSAPDEPQGLKWKQNPDSKYTPTKIGGKDAVQFGPYLYFDIDDKLAFDLPQQADVRVFVRASAYDQNIGGAHIVFDGYPPAGSTSTSRFQRTPNSMWFTGSGKWVERTIELVDPRLGGGIDHNTDFRFEAGLSVSRVAVEIMKIRPIAERTLRPGMTIDLLPLIDVEHDANGGDWTRANGTVTGDPSVVASLALPVMINGDYQLDIRFTRVNGNESVSALIPAGAGWAAIGIDGWGSSISGMSLVANRDYNDNPTTTRGRRITNGTPANLSINVTTKGTDATVRAELDGKPLFSWTGPQQSLTHFSKLARRNTPGLMTWHNETRFESIKLKLLNGSAVLLH